MLTQAPNKNYSAVIGKIAPPRGAAKPFLQFCVVFFYFSVVYMTHWPRVAVATGKIRSVCRNLSWLAPERRAELYTIRTIK